mmetsp:Transcript_1353/g.861  ORF Transcript_1353/g.861 Transcript_1353/m.861 type:complete len:121 (-) Transcript_1353:374-736(-)
MGVNYSDHYEFPEKGFFWATSLDFEFQPFPALNSQHSADKYDQIKSLFTGDPRLVHLKVEPDREDGQEAAEEQKEVKEIDPLASTEEEDEASKIVKVNLKELDRLHYVVRAIENDCAVVP